MSSMPEPVRPVEDPAQLPGAVAEVRVAAVTALQAWNVDSPEQAARLLQSWKRRDEMTIADVGAVLDAMFPADELELLDPPACPRWCTREHRGEQHVPEIRECVSAPVYAPDFKGRAVAVEARRCFDRVTGHLSRPSVVSLDDTDLTAAGARALARALLSTASLVDGPGPVNYGRGDESRPLPNDGIIGASA
jgi:hypothetical protein